MTDERPRKVCEPRKGGLQVIGEAVVEDAPKKSTRKSSEERNDAQETPRTARED